MIIGIPQALLYYKNEKFWTAFFDCIGADYILSPQTDRALLLKGENIAVDESCLPAKILLGHIDWLIGKCDYVLVPRVAYSGRYGMCTKFLAMPDVVKNTFRDREIKLLYYDVADGKLPRERKAVLRMGKHLKKSLKVRNSQIKYAYIYAKQAQYFFESFREQEQLKLLKTTDKLKIMLVAHSYCVEDEYIGKPVLNYLKALGCEAIIAEYFDEKRCIRASENVTSTMPWAYNRHLVGAIELYKGEVDGIVLLTAFPCGTDSMVNEFIVRTYKDMPVITLTADAQDGTAGIETRLESFVDIIKMKKEAEREERRK